MSPELPSHAGQGPDLSVQASGAASGVGFLGSLIRYRQAQIGLVIIFGIALIGLLAPWISPHDPVTASRAILESPSWNHPFGTDVSGFDVLSRVIHAPRVDVTIAVSATLIALLVGVPAGLVAGYYGGVLGEVMSRTSDVVQAFEFFVLAIVLLAIFGPSIPNVILVIAFVNSPIYFRLMRSQAEQIKMRRFVDAGIVAGSRPRHLMLIHILPNATVPILAQISISIAWAILLTAGVSFVGAGVQPPTPEWGVMISTGAGNMVTGQWWTVIFPGVALFVSILGYGLVANAISELSNPQRRQVV